MYLLAQFTAHMFRMAVILFTFYVYIFLFRFFCFIFALRIHSFLYSLHILSVLCVSQSISTFGYRFVVLVLFCRCNFGVSVRSVQARENERRKKKLVAFIYLCDRHSGKRQKIMKETLNSDQQIEKKRRKPE